MVQFSVRATSFSWWSSDWSYAGIHQQTLWFFFFWGGEKTPSCWAFLCFSLSFPTLQTRWEESIKPNVSLDSVILIWAFQKSPFCNPVFQITRIARVTEEKEDKCYPLLPLVSLGEMRGSQNLHRKISASTNDVTMAVSHWHLCALKLA